MSNKTQHKMNAESNCPCQSGALFHQCCQAFLDSSSGQYPETAEQLMRSRYSAFVLNDADYILRTWHKDFRPRQLDLATNYQWIGLSIKSTQLGQSNDVTGKVHFVARFKVNGKAHKLEENSLFEKSNGHWFYTKAEL